MWVGWGVPACVGVRGCVRGCRCCVVCVVCMHACVHAHVWMCYSERNQTQSL